MANIIDNKVKEIIAQQLAVGIEQLRPETSFVDDLNADFVSFGSLIMDVEQEFRLSIPEEDKERIRTVGDLIYYVNKYVK